MFNRWTEQCVQELVEMGLEKTMYYYSIITTIIPDITGYYV